MELIRSPSVLFLDEITSGLDSSNALAVMKLVKEICTERQSIAFVSIHQPRSDIFQLFDRILLLSHGQQVCHASIGIFDEIHRHTLATLMI
jgi:ABC-type multidrug transport system ATPase subunit